MRGASLASIAFSLITACCTASEFERELAAACLDQGVGVIPYSPLAAGFLTGKFTRTNKSPDSTRSAGNTIQRLLADERAYVALDVQRDIAAAHNVHPAQIALAWQLSQPVITAPIVGARRVDQLLDVVGATEVTLADEEIARLNEATDGF